MNSSRMISELMALITRRKLSENLRVLAQRCAKERGELSKDSVITHAKQITYLSEMQNNLEAVSTLIEQSEKGESWQ